MHFYQKSYFRVLQRLHEEVGLVLVALVQFTSNWNIFILYFFDKLLQFTGTTAGYIKALKPWLLACFNFQKQMHCSCVSK